MTQVTRKRSQLEKFQETNSEFAKLPLVLKIFALMLFPGCFVWLTILLAVSH